MLTKADYEQLAASVPCDVPAVQAAEDVESSGDGYLPDGRPKILFEAHHFHARTNGQYDAQFPTISQPDWEHAKRYYIGGAAEYGRLDLARSLNEKAALESASWGPFQVMGFNWRLLGYTSVQQFVEAMRTDKGAVGGFLRYIKVNNLGRYMRDFGNMQSCKAFAAGYNGPGAIGVYGPKIFNAYQHFKSGRMGLPAGARNLSIGMKGNDVKALQTALKMSNVDGDFGPATLRAARDFQAAHKLVNDGIVGPATRVALGLPQ